MMKPKPFESEKHFSKDLKTLETLTNESTDLHLLADQAEKETGRKRAALDRLIETKLII